MSEAMPMSFILVTWYNTGKPLGKQKLKITLMLSVYMMHKYKELKQSGENFD